jgi:transposase
MEDVHEEPLFCQRVAGLDIAKAEVEVTIRVPSDTSSGRRQQETRAFGTTRRELLELADWLRSWGVTKVGMEATSDYWKPVFFLLESRGFDCDLYNAAQVKALPGRPKTDLLTELRGEVPQLSGQIASRVTTFADHDHRRGRAAGSVAAGGASAGVA